MHSSDYTNPQSKTVRGSANPSAEQINRRSVGAWPGLAWLHKIGDDIIERVFKEY